MVESIDILAWAFWSAGVWDWVISAGAFTAVFLLVVCVFGQPGEVRLSPQRVSAIATGHTDRKTVFENPLLGPVLLILLSLAYRLNFPQAKAFLRRQLVAAGSPNYYIAEEYLALSMLAGLGLAAVLEAGYVLLAGSFSISAAVAGFLLGMGLAIYQITAQATARLETITRQLPYALDLISLAMGAGATFTEAVETIVSEEDDGAINVELRALLAEIELGTTRKTALENLARRVPLESMRNLVASVAQAEQLGTALGDVLHDQATLMRMQRSVRAENKAAIAGVRILVPCLLLVMAVILTIFAPAIIRIIQDGLF